RRAAAETPRYRRVAVGWPEYGPRTAAARTAANSGCNRMNISTRTGNRGPAAWPASTLKGYERAGTAACGRRRPGSERAARIVPPAPTGLPIALVRLRHASIFGLPQPAAVIPFLTMEKSRRQRTLQAHLQICQGD